MVQWVKGFTVPPGFGGQQLADLANEKTSIPETPVITYLGADGYDVNDLRFVSSEFQGAGGLFVAPQEFAAMQWRAAEISNPNTPGYVVGEPRIFEIDPVWESERITTFTPEITVPSDVLRPGKTYRVRVRQLADSGVWSHWSLPIEFQPSADISAYGSLVVSELMYHPSEVNETEQAAGYEESDFEFIELWNRGIESIDLSPLRFTKGINMALSGGIAGGERLVLARNALAFGVRYGNDVAVAGEWGADQLSNAGERVKLSFGAGVGVIDFAYDDELADGSGHSLTLEGDQWLAQAPTPGSAAGGSARLALVSYQLDLNTGTLSLTWRSETDVGYQLQRSVDLAIWEKLGEDIRSVSDETTHALEAARDEVQTRYYRIRELP